MELKVDGMSCGGCVNSVRRILVKNLDVPEDAVDVDLDSGRATIPDGLDATAVETALAKLEKAGFPAADATRL